MPAGSTLTKGNTKPAENSLSLVQRNKTPYKNSSIKSVHNPVKHPEQTEHFKTFSSSTYIPLIFHAIYTVG